MGVVKSNSVSSDGTALKSFFRRRTTDSTDSKPTRVHLVDVGELGLDQGYGF